MPKTDHRTRSCTNTSVTDQIAPDAQDEWQHRGVPIRAHGGVLVLSPRHDLCIEMIEGLVDALAQPVVRDHPHVVVDLSGVRLLCAAGVNVLVEERLRRRASGGTLTLRDPSPLSARVLGICQIPLAEAS